MSMAVRYGDVIEPFASPPIVQTTDILCAVEGFGNYCACPNADIDGCAPSGVPISTGDILQVVQAFGGADPCGCGVPSAASASVESPAVMYDRLSQPKLAMVPRATQERNANRVVVDLFVSDVATMVGFDVSMIAVDVQGGIVTPSNVKVEENREDYVFAGLHQTPLTDTDFGRVGALVQAAGPSVPTTKQAYLGTFEFMIPEKVTGQLTFQIGDTGAIFWNASRERSTGVLSVK